MSVELDIHDDRAAHRTPSRSRYADIVHPNYPAALGL